MVITVSRFAPLLWKKYAVKSSEHEQRNAALAFEDGKYEDFVFSLSRAQRFWILKHFFCAEPVSSEYLRKSDAEFIVMK